LRVLHLRFNPRIDDEALRHLTQLEYLALSDNQTITDAGLIRLTNLRTLVMANQHFHNKAITPAGVASLVKLRSFTIFCEGALPDLVNALPSNCVVMHGL
jgi:hypothetical protein